MILNTQVQQITQLPEHQKKKSQTKKDKFIKNEKVLKSGKNQAILHNTELAFVLLVYNAENSAMLHIHLLQWQSF